MPVERARLRHIVRVGLPASLYFGLNSFQMWRAQAIWEGAALLIMAVLVFVTALTSPGVPRGWHAVALLTSLFVGLLAWMASIDPLINALGFAAVFVTHVGALVLARKGMLNVRPYESDSAA